MLNGIRLTCSLLQVAAGVLAISATLNASAADEPIVAPDAVLEKLFEGKVLTEGVSVAPDGTVYFSEITFSHKSRDAKGAIDAGFIWKFDPTSKTTSIFRSPSGMSNGIKFDATGNMLVAEGADYGGRRVTRTDMKTGKAQVIAALFEGRQLNSPNDITVDEKGRIYFSDPRYLGHEAIDQPVVGVYRIDRDGSLHRIITDAGKANGVCVSPDQKSLYVVSNENGGTAIERLASGEEQAQADKVSAPLRKGLMALLAYDLAEDGTAKFRKTLVDYSPYDGPDGLVVDKDGNLYVAVRAENRPGICVYSPEGKELAYIKTEIPTNVGFGRGPDANLLYITAGSSLYRIRVNREGYQLPTTKNENQDQGCVAVEDRVADEEDAAETETNKMPETSTDQSPQPGLPTLGGMQFWGDLKFLRGYRIQRNVLTGGYRLLDVNNRRYASGTLAQCTEVLEKLRTTQGLTPDTGHAVVYLHGIARSSKSLQPIMKAMPQDGYTHVPFEYPSTQVPLEQAAVYLKSVLDSLTDVAKISFVVHSMGGIVVRRYLKDQHDPRLHRMVMMGTPNGGAELADMLKRNLLFKAIYGPAGQELVSDPLGPIKSLPTPDFEFGIVAGGKGDDKGFNRLLPGDDDGTVTVASARLSGAADFLRIPKVHAFLMSDATVIAAVQHFLEHGRFFSDKSPEPITG